MNFELLLFYALAAVALISAFAMSALVRNVLAGAICLVVTMISLAGIYVLLEAHFVAAIQIVVYAGAILMLFVFVILLLNLRVDSFGPAHPALAALRIGGIAAALSIFALLITVVAAAQGSSVEGGAEGVGRVTTNAVVGGISAIIIVDMLFVFVVTA